MLLPVLAQWALQINRLESHLVKRLLSRMNSLAHDPRCGPMVEALGHLLPFILVHLATHERVLERIDPMADYDGPSFGLGLNSPDYFLEPGSHPASELMGALRSRLDDDSYQVCNFFVIYNGIY